VLVVGGILGCALAAAAQSVDAPLERYREAAGVRELGSIHGRAFEERRKPSGPEAPLTGTALVLLPRSEAWLHRLDAIRRGARDSMESYRDAAAAVRRARDAYEKALLEAGAGDLPQGVTVDAEGRFTLEGVPAGPWVLLGFRSTYVSKATDTPRALPPGTPPREAKRPTPFQPPGRLAGYAMVTYWLREVTVAAGTAETVELTDRNVWLTGPIENRLIPRLPDQPYQPRR